MELKISGIVFLVTAWGLVLGLTVYCFAKVLRPKPKVAARPGQPKG